MSDRFVWCKSHPWLLTPCSRCGYVDGSNRLVRCDIVSPDGIRCRYSAHHPGSHRYDRKRVSR